MKICFFGDGQSIHVQKWCQHFYKTGNEVSLISFRKTEIPNINVYYVDVGPIKVAGGNWKVLLKAFQIKKLLKKINPDIFHAHYATSYGITAALINYKPFVVSTWGSDILISPKKSSLIRLLLRWAFKRASKITVVADHMLEDLFKLGVDQDKTAVITHGVDSSLFKVIKTEKNSNFTVVCTRNLEEVYNHKKLLKAFAIALKKDPSMHLKIIGDGSLKQDLIRYSEKKGIKEKVFFVGRINQKEMVGHLNQSHLFVSFSKSDGDVVSIVEAMSCGLPCIGSDIPANRLWISNNKNGFLVPLTEVDKLAESMLKAKRNYKELVTSSSKFNAEIIKGKGNWDSNMKKATKMYNSILKQL
ncbi:MAG: glycosyltransferase [Crocinitomicaceae bacterium]|nr:glycosyltransferase [Crocinitomicaceae bacterium]